jgi:hypothetical protein
MQAQFLRMQKLKKYQTQIPLAVKIKRGDSKEKKDLCGGFSKVKMPVIAQNISLSNKLMKFPFCRLYDKKTTFFLSPN